MEKKTSIKKIILIILAIILSVILLIAAVLGVKAYKLYHVAKDSMDSLSTLEYALKGGEIAKNRIDADLLQLENALGTLQSEIDGPIKSILLENKKLGVYAKYGYEILDFAKSFLGDNQSRLSDLVYSYPISKIKVDDGFNVSLMAEYLSLYNDYSKDIEHFISSMPDFSAFTKEGPLSKYQKYVDKIDELVALYNKGKKYIPLICAFIDDGKTDKNYFLVAQNTAEIRAAGGFPGAAGEITIKDGILRIGDFVSIYELMYEPVSLASNVTEEECWIFNWNLCWSWDAEYVPDFNRVAGIWADSREEYTNVRPDGVISLTPAIIQELLVYAGSVDLSDGTHLDGTNAFSYIQYEIYAKYMVGDEQTMDKQVNAYTDSLFSETARKVMSLVLGDLSLTKISGYLDVVEKCAPKKIIQLWFDDVEKENLVRSLGLSGNVEEGDVNEPVIGVYYSNCIASKLGWYLDMDIQLGEGKLVNGCMEYPLTISYTNTLKKDVVDSLWSYIIGRPRTGTMWAQTFVFAPTGGDVYDASYTMKPDYGTIKRKYNNLNFFSLQYLSLGPEDVCVLKCKVTTAPGVTKRPVIMSTPTATEYR